MFLNGYLTRFKACVVAGGNFQVYGESYIETRLPLLALSVVRVFLFFACIRSIEMAQLDVKPTVFEWSSG